MSKVCRRCHTPHASDQLVCPACWRDLPQPLKDDWQLACSREQRRAAATAIIRWAMQESTTP